MSPSSAPRAAPGGKVVGHLLDSASTATRTPLSSRLLLYGGLGALLCGLIGSIIALSIDRADRKLWERDAIADAIGVPVIASVPVAHPSSAAGWRKLLEGYDPGVVHGWTLRKALHHLDLIDVKGGRGASLTVLSLSSDPGAVALGPQLAVFAASLGIPTALVIGPRQDTNATATLCAACTVTPVVSSGSGRLQITVGDDEDADSPRAAALTIVAAVVDDQASQVAQVMRTTATVLGVSAGVATAEQLARVAISAASDGRDIAGIVVADPDSADQTTGRLPEPSRPTQRRLPDAQDRHGDQAVSVRLDDAVAPARVGADDVRGRMGIPGGRPDHGTCQPAVHRRGPAPPGVGLVRRRPGRDDDRPGPARGGPAGLPGLGVGAADGRPHRRSDQRDPDRPHPGADPCRRPGRPAATRAPAKRQQFPGVVHGHDRHRPDPAFHRQCPVQQPGGEPGRTPWPRSSSSSGPARCRPSSRSCSRRLASRSPWPRAAQVDHRSDSRAVRATRAARAAPQLGKLHNLQAQQYKAAVALVGLQHTAASYPVTRTAMVAGSVILDSAVLTRRGHQAILFYPLGGLFLGLMLGLGIVIVGALASDRLRRRDDVAYALGVPVTLSVGTHTRATAGCPVGSGSRPPGAAPCGVSSRTCAAPCLRAPETPHWLPFPWTTRGPRRCPWYHWPCRAPVKASASWWPTCPAALPAARLLGVGKPGVHEVSVRGVRLVVAVPGRDDVAPVGPLPVRLARPLGSGRPARRWPGPAIPRTCC